MGGDSCEGSYQNLPANINAQMPLPGTCTINWDSSQITFAQTTVAYLLYQHNWHAVDKTGYTQLTSGLYLEGQSNIHLWTRTYAPGTYTIQGTTAFYLFEGPASAYPAA